MKERTACLPAETSKLKVQAIPHVLLFFIAGEGCGEVLSLAAHY
jgi:hypothetical protein